MTIVEFLIARLDEDEAAAKAASHYVLREKWHAVEWYDGEFVANGRRTARVDIHGLAGAPITSRGALRREDGEHIARHDPARVLAEVAAKRAIVAMHEQAEKLAWDPRPAGTPVREPRREPAGYCGTCQVEDGVIHGEWPCDTLKHLAAVYADHHDFAPAWRMQ